LKNIPWFSRKNSKRALASLESRIGLGKRVNKSKRKM